MLADPRLSAEERKQLRNLFEMIAARFHFEYHQRLERLKDLYRPFDPDGDTLALSAPSVAPETQHDELAQAFQQLLADANFVEMPRDQIVTCAEHQSQIGLVVHANLSDYEQLQVFYRGLKQESRPVRRWRTPWRHTHQTAHVFTRVALLVRLAKQPDAPQPVSPDQDAHDNPVFLKLFKNVVAEDLEMLLPSVRIRMRLLDHLKIGSSVVGGVATAVWKVFTATILSPWLILFALSGFVGAAIRGLFGFLSRKTKYLHTLSSNLYFQNLANNSSVLAHLIDSAEIEECKELLLAYYILYVERRQDYTQDDLDRRAEQWLRAEFGLDSDVEAADAVRKLAEKDLLVRRRSSEPELAAADSVLKVYDLPSALRRLDAAWDTLFPFRRLQSAEQDRLADADLPAPTRRIDPTEVALRQSATAPETPNRPRTVAR
jgi:hypothetical protein